ncbi:Ribosomal subunit assembly and export involved protein [Komagataella phaffii CBS 7435]|uniref:Nucleolar protein involved in the assembly of the large ribosomal subunit n=2 Tax=Komagataella phaffii TaxID=460519 RepID=C4R8Z8_KOMPG|nr:Nucleolar protein involved in the assembly of the large ribosomal subunit [Komagataella phaffii GS115]AOA64775.1 GQ67_05195T0 [Komagataella phaffii]CAH2450518.1 Ribosomal subunit assembly and export involved protein [Komagataella phaffii CBS 7435]AOA69436.1 GQ68_05177T0 [Komagataella phaffii GS115]CAY72073.1 Nucleolar protein involved in the assembly of the large ribosomal subunit [Komagataella phaffii GS115]CCA40322.1 Ribosomal subunit assembly and export involved protein [Komagataella pha
MAPDKPIRVRNRLRRKELFAKYKDERNKRRHEERAERTKEERENPELKAKRLAENVPNTIESMRVFDETVNAELEGTDEFSEYFENTDKDPKVLVTTSENPKKNGLIFAKMLQDFLPGSVFVERKEKYTMKDMASYCSNRQFSDLIVVNEDKNKVTGITFIHLPTGPTFYFSVTNIIESKKIAGHGNPTSHIPELILNNFSTRLGQTVGRLFQSLFPHRPQFQGRQVVTLHNQRDFIFFRRHRYKFKNEKRVGLQELGPQFTMKLRRVQKGIREEIDWEHKPSMDRDKKKFYL